MVKPFPPRLKFLAADDVEEELISESKCEVSMLKKEESQMDGKIAEAYDRKETVMFSERTVPLVQEGENCTHLSR